jgi:ubiquinone/menaquinone biosynthesis C-methylase UbiE
MAKFRQDFERSAVIYDVDNGLSAYADEDFDFVLVASNTLRYIRKKGLLLSEIIRVLKDGAVGYVRDDQARLKAPLIIFITVYPKKPVSTRLFCYTTIQQFF